MSHQEIDCSNMCQVLSDYIDGELSDELCHRIEEHMAGCEHCRVVFDTTNKTILLCHDAAVETELPEDVHERLVETLHLEDFLKPKSA